MLLIFIFISLIEIRYVRTEKASLVLELEWGFSMLQHILLDWKLSPVVLYR